MPILFCEKTNVFHLFNDRVSYIIRLAAGKYPLHVYWGKRVRAIRDDVLSRLTSYTDETFSLHELPLDVLPQECPTFGTGDLRPGMLHIRHANGTHALDLQVVSHRILTEKPPLSGLPSARGEQSQTLLLTLRDTYSGISVELAYTIYDDIDIIARSAKIINNGTSPVVLQEALSACVDFEQADFSLLTLSGAWARERGEFIRPLVPGHQGVSGERGASGHQTSPFMALLAPNTTEASGDVYAFALCYSGSFTADVSVDSFGIARAQIGINPFNFSWTLDAGSAFQTPEAYLCYSADGLDGMSRQFHALVHRRITTGKFASSRRPILVNKLGSNLLCFSEEKLLSLARCAKDTGIELFVLDDGWFGHRESDNSSLGDWFDNTHKLPQVCAI